MSEPLVDFELAESLARRIAGAGAPDWVTPSRTAEATRRATEAVAGCTGLSGSTRVPPGEAVAREEWIRVNLGTLQAGAEALERQGDGPELPGPMGDLARGLGRRVIGAEAGAVLGFAGQRVLGQYDVALLGAERPPRLLFVAPNIAAAGRQVGHREDLLDWIALHEVTHAFQFEAAPWLRPHLGARIEALLGSNDARGMASNLLRAARSALVGDPRRIPQAVRSIDPLRSLLGPEQAEVLSALQASMSAIEGYADYVMDAAGAGAGLDATRLRSAFEARRGRRGPLETLLARIFGLELKLRQYREGRAFAEGVTGEGGIEALNALWSGPEALPAPAELAEPSLWLERVAAT